MREKWRSERIRGKVEEIEVEIEEIGKERDGTKGETQKSTIKSGQNLKITQI